MTNDIRAPVLELCDATVVRGTTRALDGLTLTIRSGEHTAILGPNGAGKSTLMKLLACEERPLAKSNGVPPIRLFGRERWNVSDVRSHLGLVSADVQDNFTHADSWRSISGVDAVVSGFFGSRGTFIHQEVTGDMRRAANDALDLMGVSHLADVTLDVMSTGEARRVLIARALVHKPAVLVLDEPTRGLDLVAQFDFMERVRDVARAGATILLVTHHVDEVIPEIDRVILLQRGRVTHDGPKPEILTAPNLSAVFGAPLRIDENNGYYAVRVTSR